jgi:hypothetical protein
MIAESPIKNRWEELGDQGFVVRPQLDRVAGLVTFAVEIVWVERAHGCQNVPVLFVCKVRVGAFSVPRVEAVIADHGQAFFRQGALVLEYVVQVLWKNTYQ